MPGFDGRGSNGLGPGTGRGLGYCVWAPRTGVARGMREGPGRGLRCRCRLDGGHGSMQQGYSVTLTDEIVRLRLEIADLKASLEEHE